MDRRRFLKTSAMALAAASASPLAAAAQQQPIGLQIYTLRDYVGKDLPGLLAKVRGIGYEEVELYGTLGHPAKELRRLLSDSGLRAPSGHMLYEEFEPRLEDAAALGLQYVICPMLPREMWNARDDFKRAAEQFNKWGEKAKAMGMRFGFHNHNYEFRRFQRAARLGATRHQGKDSGAETGFGIIVANTDANLVWLELDCYWLTQAGQDVVATIAKLKGRVKLVHIKDRKPGFATSQTMGPTAEHFTEVGTGTIDWKRVIAAAKTAGVEHYFIEQDTIEKPPLESIAISYKNLRKLL